MKHPKTAISAFFCAGLSLLAVAHLSLADSPRCLETLSRDSDPAHPALKCTAGFVEGQSTPRGNELGLRNSQFTSQGFQGETTPDGASRAPNYFRASDQKLALFSSACTDMRNPSEEACPFYSEVDAYIILDDEESSIEVEGLAKIHPWKKVLFYSPRVIQKRVKNRHELKDFLRSITQGCHVLRYVMLSSHGNKNRLFFAENKQQTDVLTVSDALLGSGLPCALAPAARVQLDGCQIACRDKSSNAAEDIRGVLDRMTKNQNFVTPAQPMPYEGVRFLINSDNGEAPDSGLTFLIRQGFHWNRSIQTYDDGAIMYSVKNGEIETDIPTSQAHACHD